MSILCHFLFLSITLWIHTYMYATRTCGWYAVCERDRSVDQVMSLDDGRPITRFIKNSKQQQQQQQTKRRRKK